MAAAPGGLYDLLTAIFKDEYELERFLALVGRDEVFDQVRRTRGGSMADTAYQVSAVLEDGDLLDGAFFRALADRDPDRSADVWAVAAEYGVVPPAAAQPPPPPAPAPSAAVVFERPAGLSEQAAPGPETAAPGDLVCDVCGAGNAPTRRFCARCGSSLDGAEVATGRRRGAEVATGRRRWERFIPKRWRGRNSMPPPPGPPPDPAGTSPSVPEVPTEYAEFAAELASELAAWDPPQTLDRGLDDRHLPWTGAAAVMGGFWATRLRPLTSEQPAESSVFTGLADVVVGRLDGFWVLEDTVRAAALSQLHATGRLQEALDANRTLADNRRDWITRLTAGEVPNLVELPLDDLTDLEVVCGWLRPLELGTQIEAAAIASTLQRRALIDPLRTLAARGFQGRAEELSKIERHIGGEAEHRNLVISGAGGVGKSSLVGEVLLRLEDRRDDPHPFAYVDFDRARNDPLDQSGLVQEIALQLRLLYATSVEATRELAAIEAVTAGTDVELALGILGTELAGDDVGGLVRALAKQIEQLPRSPGSPMLLVFDTFEEVQVRGEAAVATVRALVDTLSTALPELRVIVCGRGTVPEFETAAEDWDIPLGDLDPLAADAVLRSKKVEDPRLRSLIIQRFGGNPLTLHLAAEAVRGADRGAALDGLFVEAGVLADVAVEQVQGMLYSRILGHLSDAVVAKVAYPGLVVRRVDVPIIRDVLAEPCGLDPEQATDIFQRLQRHVALFSLDGHGGLVHRQDVRRLMLRAMQGDPKHAATALDIHRRAAAYYAEQTSREAVAEQVYHRLMTGDDPRALDNMWGRDLRRLLASAWEEPLPAAARRWLGPRLGRADRSERDEWEHEEWEFDAASVASSWLASGDPARALEALLGRPHRLAGSRLHALEVRAYGALGRYDEAFAALKAGMASATAAGDVVAQLELAEQAVALYLEQGGDPAAGSLDMGAVVEAAELASRLAALAEQPVRGITAIVTAVEGLALHDTVPAAEAVARLGDVLERRFLAMPRESLLAEPRLVRRVLRAIGGNRPPVVARAAMELGDRTDVAGSAFRDDAFALDRLLQALPEAAAPALDELAGELGLGAGDWDTIGLARTATRLGRTGQAVLLALDQATDQQAICRQIVAYLVREPDEGFSRK